MIKKAKDQNGTLYDVNKFHSGPEAHPKGRKYYDDCDIPVTPCICKDKESYFRYIPDHIYGGTGSSISLEHLITQKRFRYIFEHKETFFVKYWQRTPQGLRYFDLDLKKYYHSPIIEGKEGNRYGDVLLRPLVDGCPPLLIEVWYRHQVEVEKIKEGHLMIEFRIKCREDIPDYVRNWGIKEDYLNCKVANVRFHNFRERASELPWNNI